MNFALQTELYNATEYFNNAMAKIYIRRNCEISPFSDYAYNPKGGRCYYLSCWALMELTADSQLIRGQLDLPERPGWKAQTNYKHGWVSFIYKGEYYIYDPLESHIIPQSYWEDTMHPHDITFQKAQREIIELALNEENAHHVSEYIWQMKSAENMSLQYSHESDGFLKYTLSGAQIRYGYGQVSYMLAENREW